VDDFIEKENERGRDKSPSIRKTQDALGLEAGVLFQREWIDFGGVQDTERDLRRKPDVTRRDSNVIIWRYRLLPFEAFFKQWGPVEKYASTNSLRHPVDDKGQLVPIGLSGGDGSGYYIHVRPVVV
jgi:hypothetical protein